MSRVISPLEQFIIEQIHEHAPDDDTLITTTAAGEVHAMTPSAWEPVSNNHYIMLQIPPEQKAQYRNAQTFRRNRMIHQFFGVISRRICEYEMALKEREAKQLARGKAPI